MISVLLILFVVNSVISQASFRIFGGHDAAQNEFPFVVSIRAIDSDLHLCGGSIVSPRTVLTAAHCLNLSFDLENGTKISLRPWHPNEMYLWTKSPSQSSGGLKYQISAFKPHPFWKFDHDKKKANMNADIALVITEYPFSFSESLSVIPIDEKFVRAGIQCDFMGWGSTSERLRPDMLQKIKLITISTKECWMAYHDEPYSLEELKASKLKTSLCTATPEYGACYGDSGSPLVLHNKQVGLLSRVGTTCANRLPDIFIRMSKYHRFVKRFKVD